MSIGCPTRRLYLRQHTADSSRPTSSKEVIHDAPEVVETWLSTQHRPSSPFSEGETVVSAFQPLEFDEKGVPIAPRRESEVPPEKPRTCGVPRRFFLGVLLLTWVAITAIGLGVGLGLGLDKRGSGLVPADLPVRRLILTQYSSHSHFVEPYCVDNPQVSVLNYTSWLSGRKWSCHIADTLSLTSIALVEPSAQIITQRMAPLTDPVLPLQLSSGTIRSVK